MNATQSITETDAMNRAVTLAAERGYSWPSIRLSDGGKRLKLRLRGAAAEIDYVDDVLAPRGLAAWGQTCSDWREACRLLGLLPPARGIESN